MSYLVIARKYRPGTFEAVLGQEHVTRTLANSIKRDRIAHAYVFAGPRGVGKTSSARVLAKALNCEKGPTSEPCGECSPCIDITEGRCLAVREIDGASHNSVDNVRELIDSFRSLPPPGCRYKVYIIDEVHMLSTSAFNALLKSLEEPPPNTVFILATTEIHKIPETVLSRCQRHDFRPMSLSAIEVNLKEVAQAEGIEIEPAVLRMIARGASGSMRDAQTLLERVRSFCEDRITAEDAVKVLGAVEIRVLNDLALAIFSQDVGKALEISKMIFQSGSNPTLFLTDFVTYWRELMLASCGGEDALISIGYSSEEAKLMLEIVQDVDRQDCIDLLSIARRGSEEALKSNYPDIAFDALIARMATREPVASIGQIIRDIKTNGAPEQKKTAKKEPSRVVKSEKPKEPSEYSWEDFVAFTSSRKRTPLLTEQLKRCSVTCFEAGKLKLRGPEIAIGYIGAKDQLSKLEELLSSYFKGDDNWDIKLEQSDARGAPEPESIEAVAKTVEKKKKAAKEKVLQDHPAVQSLKRVFPGSTLEEVK